MHYRAGVEVESKKKKCLQKSNPGKILGDQLAQQFRDMKINREQEQLIPTNTRLKSEGIPKMAVDYRRTVIWTDTVYE